MFNKKTKNKQEIQTYCKCNAELNECNIVNSIKELQEELKTIESINTFDIAEKYIPRDNSWYFSEMHNFIIHLTSFYPAKYGSYEKMLSELGKEMDNYKNKENKKLEINRMIKEEKNKLGIQ